MLSRALPKNIVATIAAAPTKKLDATIQTTRVRRAACAVTHVPGRVSTS
jgi:hypothetical protein